MSHQLAPRGRADAVQALMANGPAGGSEVRFGEFRLATRERRLERCGRTVPLGGRALDILTALVLRPGEVLSKSELSDAAWPGMLVEDGSLRFHIATLRRALDDRGQASPLITTVAGRGYCFTGESSMAPGLSPSAIVQSHNASRALPTARHIFGRADAIERSEQELLARRFLTICGPPGIGKTTLALALAHRMAGSFRDGTAFVDLSSVSAPHLVPAAVAAAIGRLLPADLMLDNLLAALDDRDILLVFDGCEHLIDAVAALAQELFQRLPRLSVLATSRESLRVEGEHVYRLAPLAFPEEGRSLSTEETLDYPAVALFAERIRAGQVGYLISDEDVRCMAEICRKLDGIPLALELAAGRVASYGLKQTASLIDGHLRLLWQGWRTAPARHQTLSAAMDWSYDLLLPTEQKVLRRVAVFIGLFSMNGAQAIAGSETTDADAVAQIISDLVAKSLVVVEEARGATRYRLLDTTRVYSLSKLLATDEAKTIVRRHAAFFRDVLENDAEDGFVLERAAANLYDDQIGNVRTALQWSFSTGEDDELAVSIAAAAGPYLLAHSLASECREWMERALRVIGPRRGSIMEARLQAALGLAIMALGGDVTEVEKAFRRGLEIASQERNPEYRLRFHGGLHAIALRSGNFLSALEIAVEARRTAADLDAPEAVAMTESMLCVAHHFTGNHAQARHHERMADALPFHATRSADLQLGIDHHGRLLACLARDLWIRGETLLAFEAAWDVIESTATLDNPLSHATSMLFCGFVFFWHDDLLAAQEMVMRLVDHADRYLLTSHAAAGRALEGVLELRRGRPEAGARLLQEGIAALQMLHFEIVTPWFLGALAECHSLTGQFDQALETVEEALSMADRNGDRISRPELLLVKGNILSVRSALVQEALAAFREAGSCACRQDAPAWRLRAATDAARLLIRQDRDAEALAVLDDVLGQRGATFGGRGGRTASELRVGIQRRMAVRTDPGDTARRRLALA